MKKLAILIRSGLIMLGLMLPAWVFAADPAIPAVTLTTNPDGTADYSVTIQILALMTLLTFLPAIMMMMTSFARIIIVFAILRQALGLQQTPSNQILVGLSLFLSLFIMTPVLDRVNEGAIQPYINEEITSIEAVQAASVPFREFMTGADPGKRFKPVYEYFPYAGGKHTGRNSV